MKGEPTIVKIEKSGKIALPARSKIGKAFAGAYAVAFSEHSGAILIQPIKKASKKRENNIMLDHLLRDWRAKENDDLFDFS